MRLQTIAALLWCLLLYPSVDGQVTTPSVSGGQRLPPDPTYLVIVPRRVRPSQIVQVSATVFKLLHSEMKISVSIRRDQDEVSSVEYTFNKVGTRLLQMEIPNNVGMGQYTMLVEGQLPGLTNGFWFHNETDLIFDTKQMSLFIQTSKPMYSQGQTVKFRIIPVKPDLMPLHAIVDIYVKDVSGTVVRRWQQQQTNMGIISRQFTLDDADPTFGTWTIEVKAYSHTYKKTIEVEEDLMGRFMKPRRMQVQVAIPPFVLEDSFAITGILLANHTSMMPVTGNATLTFKVTWSKEALSKISRNPLKYTPTLTRSVRYLNGRTSFLVTLSEIKAACELFPLYGAEITIEASVYDWFWIETGTGFSKVHVYRTNMRLNFLGDRVMTFKPSTNFTVYTAAAMLDGKPVTGIHKNVTFEVETRNKQGVTLTPLKFVIDIPPDGVIPLEIEPQDDAETILVRASAWRDVATQIELTAFQYYSPTNTYLKLSTSTQVPVVDEFMIFIARANVYVETLYYMMISSANIIISDQLDVRGQQKTFSVALSRTMAPNCRILAYFLTSDGEVVADSLNFFINMTEINRVSLTFNEGKDFSKNDVEVRVEAEPGAFVGTAGVPEDIYDAGGGVQLTEESVTKELFSYDNHANNSYMYTWRYDLYDVRTVYYPSPTYGVDANTTFDFAGVTGFTDAFMTRVPTNCNKTLGFFSCFDGTCYTQLQRCDRAFNCKDGFDEMGCPKEDPIKWVNGMTMSTRLSRYYEDESWIWKEHITKIFDKLDREPEPSGKYIFKTSVPMNPQGWVASAFAMDRNKGLGLLPRPVRFDATKTFFCFVEAPETAVKGEQIGIKLGCSNRWTKFLEVLITLYPSDDFVFVNVEEGGVVSSYNPRTTQGTAIQTMIYLHPGTSRYVPFPILPAKIGKITVKLQAFTIIRTSNVNVEIDIRTTGITNYYHTPYLVDLLNQGSRLVPDLRSPIPQQFLDLNDGRLIYQPGSEQCTLSIIGDVIGASYKEVIIAEDGTRTEQRVPFLTSLNLLSRPDGGAEQIIFNYASNLYMLKYLRQTNQLDKESQKSALEFMNLALQRQLTFMDSETGAFYLYKERDDEQPSLWLTSFVAQTLQDSREGEWESILYIPIELLNKINNWICKQQNNVTGEFSGAFADPSPIPDRKLRSNLTRAANGEMVYKNISLTAFVLIGLSQASDVTGDARSAVNGAQSLARLYLEKNLKLTDVFQTTLVTYALQLSGSPRKNDAFQMMKLMNRTDDTLYWSSRPIPINPRQRLDAIEQKMPRDPREGEASAVSATSYALLSYLMLNRLGDAQNIMKWIQTQRNLVAGWGSTQDSIIALKALTEYAAQDPNRDQYNIRFSIEGEGKFAQDLILTQQNFATLYKIPIPKPYGVIKIVAQGTGLALVALDCSMNTDFNKYIRKPVIPSFDLKYDAVLNMSDRNCSIGLFEPCAKWLLPQYSPSSGLAVIEMDMPTGYVVQQGHLDEIVASMKYDDLAKADFDGQKVILYFNKIKSDQWACAKFRADRWFPVANMTEVHQLRVYEYYEPNFHNTSYYTTFQLQSLDICHVCGSFQCPYCPYYNTAVTFLPTVSFILLTIAVQMIGMKLT